MAVSDKSFAEHSKWLAFERNRFSWPKHWQVVILKIAKVEDPLLCRTTYRVLPSNPDYQTYLDEEAAREQIEAKGYIQSRLHGSVAQTLTVREFLAPPPMHLDPIEFDSMEDIDQWAAVAHRLR